MTIGHGDERRIPNGADANVPLRLNEPNGRRGRRRSPWLTAGVVVGTIASVLLVKFAFDLFLILAVFAGLAIILHAGSQVIAESELLSPAWIVISLLLAATALWLVLPEDALQSALHVERYTPKFVGEFLEWSEQRGWAQRALVAPAAGSGTGPSASSGASGGSGIFSAPAAGGTGGFARPSGNGIVVTVAVSQGTARVGQAVTISATVSFPSGPSAGASTTVRFYDGRLQISAAPIQLSGTTATASLTTTALLLGEHTITASYRGPGLFGFGTVTSSPVTVSVTQ